MAAVIPLVLAIGAIINATAVAAVVSQVYPLNESYSEMILLMGMAVGDPCTDHVSQSDAMDGLWYL